MRPTSPTASARQAALYCTSREGTITMPFEPRATAFSMATAQIMAQASTVAYREPAQCAKWATARGFTGAFDFFNNADTQGFVAESGEANIEVFRGTSPRPSTRNSDPASTAS